MAEQEKQKLDHNDTQATNQQHKGQKKQSNTKNQKQAGSATDPAAVDDKQYVERIEGKTEKH